MNPDSPFGIFGAPHPDLAAIPANPVQVSPQIPGSQTLEEVAPASFSGMAVAALPGTLERQYVLALGLLALEPGASFTVMAPKEKGGSRIAKELERFGCDVEAAGRRHQRICQTARPAAFAAETAARIEAAIASGGPRFVDAINLWSQPGVFSWDRIDPGTALLLSVLPSFAGRGADLGCGIGVIARAVLASARVTQMDLVDIDRRAITAARRNVADQRAAFRWADVGGLAGFQDSAGLTDLDFVVMNPPFHDGGQEDRTLGQSFIRQCHRMLRDGGTAWLVANLHLPYESVLSAAFSDVSLRAESAGFKVYEATK